MKKMSMRILAMVLALLIAIPAASPIVAQALEMQETMEIAPMNTSDNVFTLGAGTGPGGAFEMYRWMTNHFDLNIPIAPNPVGQIVRVTYLASLMGGYDQNLIGEGTYVDFTVNAQGLRILKSYLSHWYGQPGTYEFEVEFSNGEEHRFVFILSDGGDPPDPHPTPTNVELNPDGTFSFRGHGAQQFRLILYRDNDEVVETFYVNLNTELTLVAGFLHGTFNLRDYMTSGFYTFTVQAIATADGIASTVSAHSNPIAIVDGLTLSFDHDALPQGLRSRVIVEGNTIPVGRIEFSSADEDKLQVDAYGNVWVNPGHILPMEGEVVEITARIYSYPAQDVVWSENFEDGIIQYTAENRRGFNLNWASRFINLTGVSLVDGQTSRTGRFSYTPTGDAPPTTTFPPGAPLPTGSPNSSNSTWLRLANDHYAPAGSSLHFWYYDPMNDIDEPAAGNLKFGAGIHNISGTNARLAGLFYGGDAPAPTERFRGHLEYTWRPGVNTLVWDGEHDGGEGGFVPFPAEQGWTNGGFRTTGVERKYGWRQFTMMTKAADTVPIPNELRTSHGLDLDFFPAGTYLYIDGELIPNPGLDNVRGLMHTGTTISTAFLSTNWNGQVGNNVIRSMHFLDDIYILRPGAEATIVDVRTVPVRIVPRQYEVVVDTPVFDYFESEYPVFDFANQADVSFRVNPDLEGFVSLAIDGRTISDDDIAVVGNRITITQSWLSANLTAPSATDRNGGTILPMVFEFDTGQPFGSNFELQNNTPRAFFFDAFNGNDANDGLTAQTAWQSLEKLSGKYFPGDKIFLARGSVWNMNQASITLTGRGTPENPITLQAFGDENLPRPVINGQGTFGHIPFYMQGAAVNTNTHFYHGAIQLIGGSNWQLSGLEVTNDCGTAIPHVDTLLRTGHRGRWGIVVINPYARTRGEMTDRNWRDSLVENIEIRDMFVHHVNAGGEAFGGGGGTKFSGGIGFFGHINYSVVENSRVYKTDMTGIRNAIFHPSGTFGSPQHYPKNITNMVVFRNNYISHVHGDAFVLSGGTTGSIMEHNVVHTMGRSFLHHAPAGNVGDRWGMAMERNVPTEQLNPAWQSNHNYAALWFMGASNSVAQFNAVFHTQYRCNDGQAFDIDAGSYNVMYQFNFSARNMGGLVLFMPNDQRNNSFRYNLSVHDGGFPLKNHVVYGPAGSPGGDLRHIPHIYNNTIIIGHAPDAGVVTFFDPHGGGLHVWFENNIVYSTDPSRTINLIGGTNAPANNNMIQGGNFRNNIFYPAGLLPLNQLGPNVNRGEGDGPLGSNMIVDPLFVGGGIRNDADPPAVDRAPPSLGFSLIRNRLTSDAHFDATPLEAFRLSYGSPAVRAGRVTHNADGWAIASHDFSRLEHLPYATLEPMIYAEFRLFEDMFGNEIDHARPNIGAYAGIPESVLPPHVDRTALQEAIYIAQGLTEADYTPVSWAVMQEALAEAIAADTDEATQEQVDIANIVLRNAINALVPYIPGQVNRQLLQEAIYITQGLTEADYTPVSWVVMQEALAEAIATDTDEATQEQVDIANIILRGALAALQPAEIIIPVVDKTALIALVADVADRQAGTYTAASFAPFDTARLGAQVVLSDTEATQAQVDAAYTTLRNALNGLVETVAPPPPPRPWTGGPTLPPPAQQPPVAEIEDEEAPLVGLNSFAPFIQGNPDGTFRGANQISREEFVTILFRLNNPERLPKANPYIQSFIDVAPDRWSFDAIEWAVTEGIVEVGESETFMPRKELTRAEMAVMLVRAEGWTEIAENVFSDIEEHEKSDYILKAVYAEIFEGFPDGTFRPDSTATRFEMVTALVRYALGGPVTDNMIEGIEFTLTDVPRTHWAFRYVVLATVGFEASLPEEIRAP